MKSPAVVVAGLLLVAVPARANGTPETFAPDARTLAMAHADAADVDGAVLAHTNPAASAHAASVRMSFDYVLSVPMLAITALNRQALHAATASPVTGMAIGVVLPVDIIASNRVSVALFSYFPHLVLVRGRAHDPAQPYFHVYDASTEHYDLAAAIAVRVVDFISIGVGVRFGAGQGGEVDVAVDVVRSRLTRQAVDAYQYGTLAPQAGVLVGPLGVVGVVVGRAALVWREPTHFDAQLPAALDFEGTGIAARVNDVVLANYEPRTIAAGLSFDVFDRITANVDVGYLFWSQAPPPYLKANVDLSGPLLTETGLDSTLDAPAPSEERIRDVGFQDTLVFKVGIEGRLFRDVLALRAGYQLRPTPVPDQTSGTNIVDSRAHVFAAGVGVRVDLPLVVAQPVDFDLGYQAQVLEPRNTLKEQPRDPVGNYRSSGVVHAFACGMRYAF